MQALVVVPKEKLVQVADVPIPQPGPNEILVKVRAVALNKVDYLYTARPVAAQVRRIVGSDFAGVVSQVGRDVTHLTDARVQVGARVAGFVQGAASVNERPGAFAEYVALDWDLTWNIPTDISFEQAACVNLCGLTAAQGVFRRLQMPCPFSQTPGSTWLDVPDGEPLNVFINGAASSLGLYAAQLVRLSAHSSNKTIRLIGTASMSNHALLRSAPYSYDVLVDYKDNDWPQQVKAATGSSQGVQYALDAVSTSPGVELIDQTLDPRGRFAVFRAPAIGGFDVEKLRVKPIIGAVWVGLGVKIEYQGSSISANAEERKFATEFYNCLSSGAASGDIRLFPNPVRIIYGGLKEIGNSGLDLVGPNTLGQRSLSAEKAVFTL